MAKKKVNLFKQRDTDSKETRLSDKSYLDNFIPEDEQPPKKQENTETVLTKVGEEKPVVKRATFVVYEDDLNLFRDIIHTEKRSGNYEFTQKDSFARAMELLKAEALEKHGRLEKAPPPRKGRW